MRLKALKHKQADNALIFSAHLLFFVSVLLCLAVIEASGQKRCEKQSEESPQISIGANQIIVESRLRKVNSIQGQVLDLNGEPIANAIVDVFPLTPSLEKFSSWKKSDEGRSFRSFKSNKRGEYCLADLPEGRYELRYGTSEFAFNHLIIQVQTKNSFARKTIEVKLSPGT